MPEADTALHDYLEDTKIIHGDTLTDDAHQLIDPLIHYNESWWGISLLYSLKQDVRLHLDDELASYNLGYAITSIPRVYYLLTRSGNKLTTAVRADDDLIIQQTPIGSDVNNIVATTLMSVLDPEHNWEPARMSTLRLPHTALRAIGNKPLSGEKQERERQIAGIKKAFADLELSPELADQYVDILSGEMSARAEVLHSSDNSHVSRDALSLGFYVDRGVVVMSPERRGRTVWVTMEGGSMGAVAGGLGRLGSVGERGRLGLRR